MSQNPDAPIDPVTGVSCTGHEWDGIQELNNPLPRWWLWTWYLCILFAIGYWVAYPAWPLPGGATEGILGWHSRSQVVADLDELTNLRADMSTKVAAATLPDIMKSSELLSFSQAQGKAIFANNCAPCHGAGGQGSPGYPNLVDDDWLWGGKLADIQTTITHGIRWDADKNTRSVMMPSFGRDGTLKPEQISDVADYVRSLSGLPGTDAAAVGRGKPIFAENCAACHGDDGAGNQAMGAPNLTDQIWLYGSDKPTIMHRIEVGGGGVMPAWAGRLNDEMIKAVTIYVYSQAGGK